MSNLPARTLELLSAAMADFLSSPESEAKFNALDWMLRVAVAKWGDYAVARRVAGTISPMPEHSVVADR